MKNHLEKKFIDFKKDNNIKHIVSQLISNIYQNKKDDAIKKYKEISTSKIDKDLNIVGF